MNKLVSMGLGSIIVFACAAHAGISDYMPRQVGDFWIQGADNISAKAVAGVCTLKIEGIDSIGTALYYRKKTAIAPVGTPNDNWRGSSWYMWEGGGATEVVWGAFSGSGNIDSATIYKPSISAFDDELLTNGAVKEFDIVLPLNQTHYYIQSLGYETITVPAGTFADCLKLKTIITNPAGDTTQYSTVYYGKNVGEVMNVSWNPWFGDAIFKLTSYNVATATTRQRDRTFESPEKVIDCISSSLFTGVSYFVQTPGNVHLVLYDPLGRTVRVLVDEAKPRGLYSVLWARHGSRNSELAGCAYLCALSINDVPVAILPLAIMP